MNLLGSTRRDLALRVGVAVLDRKLAVVVIPVVDVDRAKEFYAAIGFREDFDVSSGEDFRVVRFTPPGSTASIIFGRGITAAIPGSVEGLVLAVRDVSIARADLMDRGVDVTDAFHDLGGVF